MKTPEISYTDPFTKERVSLYKGENEPLKDFYHRVNTQLKKSIEKAAKPVDYSVLEIVNADAIKKGTPLKDRNPVEVTGMKKLRTKSKINRLQGKKDEL